MCSSDIFLGLIAILFPPIAVWVKRGVCSADSLINICLCMLGFVPGLLHAWYIIAKFPDENNEYDAIPQDAEAHRVHYIIVQDPNGTQHRVPKGNSRAQSGGYGTTGPMVPPIDQAPVNQATNGTWNNNGAPAQGSSSAGGPTVPPTYAEAVRGDHKVQSRD